MKELDKTKRKYLAILFLLGLSCIGLSTFGFLVAFYIVDIIPYPEIQQVFSLPTRIGLVVSYSLVSGLIFMYRASELHTNYIIERIKNKEV